MRRARTETSGLCVDWKVGADLAAKLTGWSRMVDCKLLGPEMKPKIGKDAGEQAVKLAGYTRELKVQVSDAST